MIESEKLDLSGMIAGGEGILKNFDNSKYEPINKLSNNKSYPIKKIIEKTMNKEINEYEPDCLKSNTPTESITSSFISASLISDQSIDILNKSRNSTSLKSSKNLITCKSSNYDMKNIYNSLNEIDDQFQKEILNDYFYNDSYMLDSSNNGSNSIPQNSAVLKTPLSEINNNTNNNNFKTPLNKLLTFNEWNDDLNEWSYGHPYPSLKNYVNSLNKRRFRKTDIEFDEDLGIFVPIFKPQFQNPQLNSTSNINQMAQKLPNSSNHRFMKELHKIVNGSSNQSNKKEYPFNSGSQNNLVGETAQNNQPLKPSRNNSSNIKRTFIIKTNPFSTNSIECYPNTPFLMTNQIPIKNDENERIKPSESKQILSNQHSQMIFLSSDNPVTSISNGLTSNNRENEYANDDLNLILVKKVNLFI